MTVAPAAGTCPSGDAATVDLGPWTPIANLATSTATAATTARVAFGDSLLVVSDDGKTITLTLGASAAADVTPSRTSSRTATTSTTSSTTTAAATSPAATSPAATSPASGETLGGQRL